MEQLFDMAAEIAVIIPVLNRPQNAAPVAASLAAATTVPYHLHFICTDGDDDQIHAVEEVERREALRFNVDHLIMGRRFDRADFAIKVNWAYEYFFTNADPWIFQAADDVTFEPGWDVALLECAERTGALVIGTQDGGNPTVKRGLHSTHTLIARSYCDDPGASMDGPGTVFSTAYGHQYCDTELVELAKARGVWAFCDDARVTHHHPFWTGGNVMDETYLKGLATSREDAAIFRERSKMWALW